MNLELLIRAALADGADSFSLTPAEGRWQANVRCPGGGFHVGVDDDPIAALVTALTLKPAPLSSSGVLD